MSILPEIMVREGNVIPFPARRPKQSVKDALTESLNANDVGLHYQPQYNLTTGEMVGIEALLRLRNADGEMLNAHTVVKTAEREQLIEWLGSCVLRAACREFSELREKGCDRGRLAINVSPYELRQSNYAHGVLAAIESAGLNCNDIELEITESASLSDTTLILGHLDVLAQHGVRIAIDDFGTGHTAWSHVLALPVSTLKVDRSLAEQVVASKKAEVVVRHLCGTCEELDIQVIGEGIDSLEQQSALVKLGCTIGQGFGLARPVSASELALLPSNAPIAAGAF